MSYKVISFLPYLLNFFLGVLLDHLFSCIIVERLFPLLRVQITLSRSLWILLPPEFRLGASCAAPERKSWNMLLIRLCFLPSWSSDPDCSGRLLLLQGGACSRGTASIEVESMPERRKHYLAPRVRCSCSFLPQRVSMTGEGRA